MDKLIWIALVALAGAMLPLQAGLNARIGTIIESPIHASLISFFVGSIGILAYIITTKQSAQLSEIRNIPPHAWASGLFGAFYVTVVILAFPRLGAALTFGLVVAGQLLLSVGLDHFKILVVHQQPFSAWRFLGISLIVLGVIIIRKF
jgi:bacterial/archaeal transporter family-2 protein